MFIYKIDNSNNFTSNLFSSMAHLKLTLMMITLRETEVTTKSRVLFPLFQLSKHTHMEKVWKLLIPWLKNNNNKENKVKHKSKEFYFLIHKVND